MMSQVGWTFEEDKAFEMALARYFTDADRWVKIANVLPHKSPTDVQQRFWALETDIRRIEDGCGRPTTPCLPQMLGAPSPTVADCKKVKLETAINGDRRKGVPWTEEEHRLFLLGLAKFGKGDWRSIARNFVVSRTPTQVASHAQKYFIRLNSLNKKDKRRASIHDITSVNNGNGGHNNNNNNHWAEAAGRTQAQPPTSQAGGSTALPAVYM